MSDSFTNSKEDLMMIPAKDRYVILDLNRRIQDLWFKTFKKHELKYDETVDRGRLMR